MILRLDGIDFSYHGNQPVFKNLDLTIPLNCWAVLTGDCGTGKTTLAKLIAGLLKPDKGSIRFENDNDVNNSLEVGYIFQNPDDQFVHFNIEREVAFNLENRGASPAIVRKAVQLALDKVNLWPRRENSPHELSGGEKQKLTIADWLVSKPQVLIFDETTAFLDLPTRFELYENIRRLIVDGLSVIWISQEDYEIAFADYIIELLPGYLLRTSSNK